MPEEPKIFVDEDWKAQVQREREAALQQPAPEDAAPAEGAAPDAPEPGSFLGLVSSLAMQCMYTLGLIAPEGQKQVLVDLDQAQYLLDTLAMLREKTRGNLTPEEEASLTQALAELGDVYVARVQQFQEETIRRGGAPLV